MQVQVLVIMSFHLGLVLPRRIIFRLLLVNLLQVVLTSQHQRGRLHLKICLTLELVLFLSAML